MGDYKTIMGLEVHIEPNTKSKMFCRCAQDHFGKKPNTQTCPICLGLPGALPFANKAAVEKTVQLGLALGSEINKQSRFFRKHYFYPDLPKSFQTSQKDDPICVGGNLNGKAVNHIHLEEDAGKLVHETIDGKKYSLVDFNRSGCALIEMVTEPVFSDVAEVIKFLKDIQLIAKYLDISNADMEKGTMRLEANISLSKNGSLPDYKVELKNINSFRFLEKAINAEIKRQSEALDRDEKLSQETRGYDEIKKTTYSQRSKADSHDYRYFPEADLPPIVLSKEYVEKLKSKLPELPEARRKRFENQYGLSQEYSEVLISDPERADYFERAAELDNNYKIIASMMVNKKLDQTYPEPARLIKKLLELTSIEYEEESVVGEAITSVLSENPDIVTSYKNGKKAVLGFLIGQVQKKVNGRGDPKLISSKLLQNLNGK